MALSHEGEEEDVKLMIMAFVFHDSFISVRLQSKMKKKVVPEPRGGVLKVSIRLTDF